MDRDNEIELIETIQEKDKKIKELEAMNGNIGRELLARTDELNEVLEKQKNSVPKDKIREKIEKLEKETKPLRKDYEKFGMQISGLYEKEVLIQEYKKLLEEG